jgi:hypothetical protein
MLVLRKSGSPEQREWAADNLGHVDWRKNPHMVKPMLSAARGDAAPIVRVACVRSMSKMGLNTPEAIATLRGLKGDADVRVRQEAELAMMKLTADQPASPYRSMKPASTITNFGSN